MKRREMEQHMAAGTSVGVKRDQYSTAREATILEVGVTRRVYSGQRWDFSGHNAHDGVRVKFVNDDTEAVVGARNVGDWETMSAAATAARQREQEKAERLARQKASAEAAVQRLGVGRVAAKYAMTGYSITGYVVELTGAEAERLTRKDDA